MDKPTYILGINTAYHELSAALIKDGTLVTCIEEERLSRIKHGKYSRIDNPDVLPLDSMNYCLKTAGIKSADIDFIGISFNPRDRLKNINVDPHYESGSWGSQEGEKLFFDKLCGIPDKLASYLGQNIQERVKWIPHHICHAASTFHVSPYEKAAIICADGIGEFASTWLGEGNGNKLATLKEIDYPNSLGFLWEKISKFLGFSEYDAAKVMGLASYGNYTIFYQQFQTIVTLQPEGGFTIDNDIMKFRLEEYSSLERLFGIEKINSPMEINPIHENIAASLQKITNDVMLHLAKYIADKTLSENLCLAGGVALNCVANYELLKSNYFKNIYIQPAAHDAGTALGAAFYIWNSLLGNKRTYIMSNSYTSAEYTEREIENILQDEELEYEKYDNIAQKVAELLTQKGNIIGWFQSKMEWGPRALGNRSLLADPRNPEMKEILNLRIKKREPFRPFSPSVLKEDAYEWFEIPYDCDSISKEFMLLTFPVKKDKIKKIPAVVHVDNTSRIQVVTQETNSKYHRLISEFKKLTGIPMILNTSFNDNEPIVCSPIDAVRTFRNTKMDYLAIGDLLVSAN